MVEKRQDKRSPIELAASYGIGEDPRPEREAKISNISSSGFCFTSDHKLRVGEKIHLVVDLDTTEDITMAVKVVWVNASSQSGRYMIGVQIDEKEGPGFERFTEFYNSAF